MDNRNLDRITGKKTSKLVDSAVLFGISGDAKIEKFEGLLDSTLNTSDSIKEAVEKMVKAALTVEFGESLLDKKEAKNMVNAISATICSDSELRRQALIIMDRFAKPEELNA